MAPQNETNPDVKVAVTENVSSYHFIERVSGLPIVHSALETAKSVYDGTKNKLPIIAQVENGISQRVLPQLIQTSEPLVRAVPFSTLDNYACKGLDVIEKNIPMVKETPQEIIGTGKAIIDSRIIVPVNGIVSRVDGIIEQAITYSEQTVATYTKEEKTEEEKTAVVETNKITRVQNMGKKIGTTALHQIQRTPQELRSIDIVKYSTGVAEKQVKRIREAYSVAVQSVPNTEHLQKIFDGYVKDLTSRVDKVRQQVGNMKSVNVKETTRSALISLSEGLTEFSTKASKSISDILAREEVKSRLPLERIEASLATLKSVSEKLISLASKYTTVSISNKAASSKKEEEDEIELKNKASEEESIESAAQQVVEEIKQEEEEIEKFEQQQQ